MNPKYRKLEAFQPGHNSLELVQAELNGCFYDESKAEAYLHGAFAVQVEAERIFG